MSQLGRISGPLLSDNLFRNGVDLSFETSLLYLDVSHKRIGVNTSGPTRDLTIVGTTNITNDLTVSSSLKVGNITLGPNNYISTLTGNLNLSATTINSTNLATDNLLINNNFIQSITNNTDVIIADANGFNIYSNTVNHGNMEVTGNILIDTNLHVFGNLNLGTNSVATDDITFSGKVANDIFPSQNNFFQLGNHNEKWQNVYLGTADISSNITINSLGTISSTTSNTDLILTSATGSVNIENLNFSTNTLSATSNIVFNTPNAKLKINGSNSLKIPVGTENDRLLMTTAEIRYSTSDGRFRGFSTANITFGGIFSDDRLSYIIPESSLNANDKIINFVVNSTSKATVNSNKTKINSVHINDMYFYSDTISTTIADSNLYLSPAGAGSVIINNLTFKNNTISSIDNFNLSSNANGYINFNSTIGMRIPSGDSFNRLLSPPQGLTRFNTDLGYLEIYTGSTWEPAQGTSNFISANDMLNLTIIHSLLLGS